MNANKMHYTILMRETTATEHYFRPTIFKMDEEHLEDNGLIG